MRLKRLKFFRNLLGGIKFSPAGEEGRSLLERFWRPLFGYCVSLTWVAYILTICWTALSKGECTAEIINALLEAVSLWSMALGVLGVSVVKSSSAKQKSVSKQETDMKQQHKL
ncbi:MAG: hypothetical protein ACI4OW_00245 [Alphaproteobacteria bacterium]